MDWRGGQGVTARREEAWQAEGRGRVDEGIRDGCTKWAPFLLMGLNSWFGTAEILVRSDSKSAQ